LSRESLWDDFLYGLKKSIVGPDSRKMGLDRARKKYQIFVNNNEIAGIEA
jgi:hypothetical protein